MAHACNPSTLGGRGGWIPRSRDRDHPGQHGETPSLLKIEKISWAWWHVPVIPATQEAEAGELPEPRRRRLRWAEIAPLHSSLGNESKTPSQKKKRVSGKAFDFQVKGTDRRQEIPGSAPSPWPTCSGFLEQLHMVGIPGGNRLERKQRWQQGKTETAEILHNMVELPDQPRKRLPGDL